MSVNPSRDSVTTICEDGSRRFLHPSEPRGQWVRARRAVAWMLIALFAAIPWIEIGGYPAVFLDVEHRRFHLLGQTLGLGDLWLLFFAISGVGFTIYAVTALLGRIWCGWACPQTVYMEHVFRQVDRMIEGDHLARARLDGVSWIRPEKLLRRGSRLLVYLVLCWLVAHIFLAYFVSIPGLYPMVTGAPTAHPTAFVAMMAVTVVLFFNFWWFREQLCLIICPYGRLQSALIDDNSVIVGYDALRGEPRGKPAAGAKVGAKVGDCVDCRKCVQVCPTGIDIRQGLQMECIACTACIDACDAVMTRLSRPTGLIRYASLSELAGGRTQLIRPRTVIYGVLFLIGAMVAALSALRVQDAGFKLTRPPGTELYSATDLGISNVYRAKIQNKSDQPVRFFLSAEQPPVPVSLPNQALGIEVGSQAEITLPLVVTVARDDYRGEFDLRLRLTDATGKIRVIQRIHFIGPHPPLPAGK
ncbi:MAG: cytochrome c oxidase accessory protein CcoG [Opitutia bacterium]|jgi:cytochrome c oxidase accessory protein FixG